VGNLDATPIFLDNTVLFYFSLVERRLILRFGRTASATEAVVSEYSAGVSAAGVCGMWRICPSSTSWKKNRSGLNRLTWVQEALAWPAIHRS
jgi:hypothetical protein